MRYIREHADQVKANCQLRRVEADIDALLELDDKRKALVTELQLLQQQQNDVSKQMKQAKSQDERAPLIEKGKELKTTVANLQEQTRQVEEALLAARQGVPNMTHPDSPRGDEDKVVREVGTKPTFDFKPLDHVDLCEKHDLADFEKASKVTGSSFYYLKGDGALLELALIHFAIRELVAAGFTPVITPDLAREKIMDGTGYIPRGPETQIYSIENTDLCLIATAEITLAGMLADDTLTPDDLPLKMVGLSHCFRTEAGAAGRATRGLFRVHQFTKVEMFIFTTPEQSDAAHQELLELEVSIFEKLGIPFHVVDIRADDLGGPAYRKYDLEAWMPGRGDAGEYAEITSTSNCTDYQARRLNIRYKTPGEKGTHYVHMLNGTAVALSRALIAIMENYQQPDGTIKVPDVLVPYMGKEVIGKPAS